MSSKSIVYPIFSLFFLTIFAACSSPKPPETDIAETPEQLDVKAADIIRGSLEYAAGNEGKIDDSIRLSDIRLVQLIYENNEYNSLWSSKENWKPLGDSLRNFIGQSQLYGLFPEDYHFSFLDSTHKKFLRDTMAKTARRDAVLWSKTDLLLTDALIHIIKDIKLGRLPNDSITLRKDSVLSDSFFVQQFQLLQQKSFLQPVIDSLEPRHSGYRSLKAAIKLFLDSANYNAITIVPSRKDTANFKQALQKRLFEGGFIAYDSVQVDSALLSEAVKAFQKSRGITVDGKVGDGTIRMLNFSDRERFVRIAISLDRYKLLPEQMPSRYVWVNLPGYNMQLVQDDTVLMSSKIICGKNITRTPLLTSAISNLVTYPQWTIPTSIIIKEVLPGIKKNPEYLSKRGYSLINDKGDVIDPYEVDWTKYKKGIP